MRIRPVVVWTAAGRSTVWLPSFGVEAASTVGKVAPSSVDSRIRTFDVLVGAASVPATFQVTGSVAAVPLLVSVACEVRRNGPAPALTVSDVSAKPVPPASGLPSRAVTRKSIVRLTLGRYSDQQSLPASVVTDPQSLTASVLSARTWATSGKSRAGLVVVAFLGVELYTSPLSVRWATPKTRNSGPIVSGSVPSPRPGPGSSCSHMEA